jgi:acetyl-CoA acetyltransferase
MSMMADTRGVDKSPPNSQYFANAGREYMEKYGAEARDFVEIARISHEHSQRYPYAQFRDVYSLEQIEQAPMIHWPLTKLQCSPTLDGAGAAVTVSQRFLDARPHLSSQAVLMAGQSLLTNSPQLYAKSSMNLVGYDITRRAAKAALDEARMSPKDVKICELHDCFSTNELMLLEGLDFSEPGKAHHMVRNGDSTYGEKGLLSIRPVGSSAKAILWVRLDSHSALSSHGSFAGGRTTDLWKTRTWLCNTTWDLVERSSLPCTRGQTARRTQRSMTMRSERVVTLHTALQLKHGM